ncbi:MAG: PEP-CTERM sorting domain-containing protein, partial [Bacteroidetes bacterium]|nr:PEP-CTERM sorting domain-containing protein [Bacteroidota bacterium]
GIKLDFQPNTKDVKGGIYNPSATNGLASGPNHFSKAILNITFNSSFTLDENSPKVRMKNVGLNGEGSLKLDGTSVTQPVPEPMTMLGWGTGLAVGALAKKKYGQKKSATSKV